MRHSERFAEERPLSMHRATLDSPDGLTDKQREYVYAWMGGDSYAKLAKRFGVYPAVVRRAVEAALKKMRQL